MTQSQSLRLVSKTRYNEQTFATIPFPSNTLPKSSVRIRTSLVGLTSNNLAYCALGNVLHWWSTFPLPASTPVQYSDDAQYGLSPAWGYGTVLESTIDGIGKDRIIYGFMPVSSHAIDLQLRQSETMPGHWIETSPHRSRVMNLYQRYYVLPTNFSLSASNLLAMWTPVIKPVWEAGYLLAHYVFPQDGKPPIHPFGVSVTPWTKKEADISNACIVCLAAGTKTSRSFLYQLSTIGASSHPEYDVIEVTSGAVGCEKYLNDPSFRHRTIKYGDISPEMFPPREKFVILNFGGQGNALAKVAESVTKSNPSTEIVVVTIGGEAKVYTEEALKERMKIAVSLNAVQMNTTGIRDEAMKRLGEERYFEELERAFGNMVQEQVSRFEGTVLGVRLKVGSGLRGDEGVENIWSRLSAGQITGDEGMVVRLDEPWL